MIDIGNLQLNQSATGAGSPFRTRSKTTPMAASLGLLVQLTSLDAPGFEWPNDHPAKTNFWETVGGGVTFKEVSVAYSASFPQTYLGLHQGVWSMNLAGANDGTDKWAKGTTFGDGVTKVSDLSNAVPLIQTLGLSYYSQNKLVPNPPKP